MWLFSMCSRKSGCGMLWYSSARRQILCLGQILVLQVPLPHLVSLLHQDYFGRFWRKRYNYKEDAILACAGPLGYVVQLGFGTSWVWRRFWGFQLQQGPGESMEDVRYRHVHSVDASLKFVIILLGGYIGGVRATQKSRRRAKHQKQFMSANIESRVIFSVSFNNYMG